jgi:hypothetical protein
MRILIFHRLDIAFEKETLLSDIFSEIDRQNLFFQGISTIISIIQDILTSVDSMGA